jgi:hypothetical protein
MSLSAKYRACKVLPASLLCLALVSYADYVTGNDMLFFLFYYVPVALCAWYLGWRSTLGMAVISGISWFAVDWLSGPHYSQEAIRYWNSVICFVAFALMGLVLYRLREALSGQQRAQAELARAYDELARSAEEVCKLQSGLQVVCAWTKRIRVDGQWMPFDKFLAEKLHISVSHGLSPEALEHVRKALEAEGQTPPSDHDDRSIKVREQVEEVNYESDSGPSNR